MALPFINPVSQCMPGFGSPSYYGAATSTATTTSTITIAATSTTPSTGGTPFNNSGGPAPTSGKWHLRVTNATGTSPTLALVVQVTDGTNTWDVASFPSIPATFVDLTGEFKTDVNITAVNFVCTIGGTTPSLPIDAEVSLV